jgi:acyl-CoA synthetase (AMP-forming)/AMP-acid ligase II
MMSIEMIGGVYCPLSPRNPEHRLHALLQQTQSPLVLVHHLTKTKFDRDIISVDINLMLHFGYASNNCDCSQLRNVKITMENIAYTIFTSGSTGTPKAVSH